MRVRGSMMTPTPACGPTSPRSRYGVPVGSLLRGLTMNAHGFALVLVRWLGLLFLALGVQGVLGVVFAETLSAWALSVLPSALRDNFAYFYAADLWGTPFYLLAGIVLWAASKRLARAISRDAEA